MYTHCLHCDTWFAVGATHLRIGHGEVRCGHCMQTFDALLELTDERPQAATEEAARAEQLVMTALANEEEGEGLEAISFGAVDTDVDVGADVGADVPLLDAAQGDAAPEQEVVPEVLREDLALIQAVRRARHARTWYGAISLILTVALMAQFVWFNPQTVRRQYPLAADWITRFCNQTGCELPPERDLAKVTMLGRDVRIHPSYEGALQVHAAIVNSASFNQPFPNLEFTLFNVNGQIIATRSFAPDEYLNAPEVEARGMVPRTATQLTLDLLAPEQAAVSFEFKFL